MEEPRGKEEKLKEVKEESEDLKMKKRKRDESPTPHAIKRH